MKIETKKVQINGEYAGGYGQAGNALFTTPPAPSDCVGALPEFGRWRDVERLYGIKRGILYRKIADGTIKSVSLREPGKKFGVRLIYLQSVRDWLHRELEAQNPSNHPDSAICNPENPTLSECTMPGRHSEGDLTTVGNGSSGAATQKKGN